MKPAVDSLALYQRLDALLDVMASDPDFILSMKEAGQDIIDSYNAGVEYVETSLTNLSLKIEQQIEDDPTFAERARHLKWRMS